MRRLLVTGGAGFIGANFVQYWLDRHPGDRLVVLDALTYAGNLANLAPVANHPGFSFCHGDILDEPLVAELLQREQINTIVHFAAESHVDRSIQGPDAFLTANVLGTHALLKVARKAWENTPGVRFHHISTDEVYGSLGLEDPPFTENTPFAPNSPYAASKAASDHLVRAYFKTYGLPVTISHCSNNYGPYQFPEKLIPLMLTRALEGGVLPVYGDGENVRDWLYVEEHNRAVERILEAGKPGETYNIGGDNEWSNNRLVDLLCDILDQSFARDPALAARFPNSPPARGGSCHQLVTHVPDRLGHDRRYAILANKIKEELGFVPEIDFDQGFRRTVAWYLAQESWWRGVLDGSYRFMARTVNRNRGDLSNNDAESA